MGGLSHTVSGDIASFRTPSRVPIESLKFHFLPKQAEGTPTLENPIPIEGWTELNGKRCHKNLIKPYYTEETTYYGIPITPTANGVRVKGTAAIECAIRLSSMDVRYLDEGKKYTFSLYVNGDISGCKDPYIGYYDGVGYWGTMGSLTEANNHKLTWTVPSRYANATAPWFDMYIRIKEGSVVDFEIGLQMEAGENSTTYEPFSEVLIPITFPDGETIYGGYVDPVVGEIVATFKKINLKNKAWYYYTSNQFALTTDKKLLSEKVFCDMLPVSKINGYPTDDKSIGFWGNGRSYANIIFIKYEASNDINDFKAWLNSLESDPCLIYEFADPIHIPISAQDLKAFLDHNNFWSDANDITEVTYPVTESKDILATRKKAMAFGHAHHKKLKWNQLVPISSMSSSLVHGQSDGSILVQGTTDKTDFIILTSKTQYFTEINGHKYFLCGNPITNGDAKMLTTTDYRSATLDTGYGTIYESQRDSDTVRLQIRLIAGTYDFTIVPVFVDLTVMFGAGKEPSTVDEFKHICEINGIDLTTYQPYDEGSDRWLIVP